MLIYETIYGDWIFLEIRRILEHAETDLIIYVLWAALPKDFDKNGNRTFGLYFSMKIRAPM